MLGSTASQYSQCGMSTMFLDVVRTRKASQVARVPVGVVQSVNLQAAGLEET